MSSLIAGASPEWKARVYPAMGDAPLCLDDAVRSEWIKKMEDGREFELSKRVAMWLTPPDQRANLLRKPAAGNESATDEARMGPSQTWITLLSEP